MRNLVEKINLEIDWRQLPKQAEQVIEQALAIQQIPAPTFHEEKRARYVQQQFREIGLAEVTIDPFKNVYGLLVGKNHTCQEIMITAHLDTVFPIGTDLGTRTENGLIYGPGLGDNSVGVAGLLGLASLLVYQTIVPACNIWFVATSAEEGLGDLKGMKAAFAKFNRRIGSVINIEGLAFGHAYNAGVAVRRLHIQATSEGGHSWLHFGRASAVHGIVELGGRIAAIRPPDSPRTTYNIGMIDGGHAINAISTQANLWLDLRSEAPSALQDLEQQIRKHTRAIASHNLTFEVRIVGDRPAGKVEPDHPLIQCALMALEAVGIHGTLETGSTDGNVSLAKGCPTVTVGITRGGNVHRLDEYIETEPVKLGLRQLILLTLATATDLAETPLH